MRQNAIENNNPIIMKKSAKNNKGCLRVSCLQRKKTVVPLLAWDGMRLKKREGKVNPVIRDSGFWQLPVLFSEK